MAGKSIPNYGTEHWGRNFVRKFHYCWMLPCWWEVVTWGCNNLYYFNILTRKNKHKFTIIENLKTQTDKLTLTLSHSSSSWPQTDRVITEKYTLLRLTQKPIHKYTERERQTQKKKQAARVTHIQKSHTTRDTHPHLVTHIPTHTHTLNLEEKS